MILKPRWWCPPAISFNQRKHRTNICTILLAVLSTRDALQNKPWSWVECRVDKEVGPSLCISRLPKPTLASCCRGHLFCAVETHHRCDPPAHSRMLSLACRRPWPWNSLCRTQSCRFLADTLQMRCVPSHSLLSMDGRHDNTTYVHVHVHRQACCDVLLPHCAL